MNGDLAAFYAARLDEDKERAWAVHDVSKCDAMLYEENFAAWAEGTKDCDCGYPDRVLREVAAKRAILELHQVHSEPTRWGDNYSAPPGMRGQLTGGTTYWCDICDYDRDYGHIGSDQEGCDTLRHAAGVYSGHPGYRDEWKPSTTSRFMPCPRTNTGASSGS